MSTVSYYQSTTGLFSDSREGGSSFYKMSGEDGTNMYGRIHYKQITPPEMMVYLQEFCDEKEQISRHPKAPVWPEKMGTTVLFSEEGVDQTRVTVIWEPQYATPEELAVFISAKPGMTQGWTGSFDKLEDHLSKTQGI